MIDVLHPVEPEGSLPAYQRIASLGVHWLLYVLVLLTTFSGWLFASARGWQIPWFFWFPLPMLTGANQPLLKAIDGWHQILEWTLLGVIGLHFSAALLQACFHRDGVMRRMLPRKRAGDAGVNPLAIQAQNRGSHSASS